MRFPDTLSEIEYLSRERDYFVAEGRKGDDLAAWHGEQCEALLAQRKDELLRSTVYDVNANLDELDLRMWQAGA